MGAPRRWNPDNIIEKILLLKAENKPLRKTDVLKEDSCLVNAASFYFGTWSKALVAAGILKTAPPKMKWTKEVVAAEIIKRYKEGKSIKEKATQKDNGGLAHGVNRRFGNWTNMLKELGFEEFINVHKSKESVLEEIQKRVSENKSLVSSIMRYEDVPLYNAGKKHFGSWGNAVIAAGLEYHKKKSPRKITIKNWTKDIVIEQIKKREKDDKKLNSRATSLDNYYLHTAAIQLFGSWSKALVAAGYDLYTLHIKGFWDKQLVVRKLKERHENGKSFYTKSIVEDDSNLYKYARDLFGSYKKALAAAGFEHKRKPLPHNGEEILGRVLRGFFPHYKIRPNYRNLDWLVSLRGRRLELDFYIKGLSLGIELQGPCHFLPLHGEECLSRTRENDERKRVLCKEHNFTLIQLPYEELCPCCLSRHLTEKNVKHIYSDKYQKQCDGHRQWFKESPCPCSLITHEV